MGRHRQEETMAARMTPATRRSTQTAEAWQYRQPKEQLPVPRSVFSYARHRRLAAPQPSSRAEEEGALVV